MRTSIIVQNLKCGGCTKTITNKLEEQDGISNVEIVIDRSKISFDSNTPETALHAKSVLKSLGYPSIDGKNSFFDKTKSFVSCATGKMS